MASNCRVGFRTTGTMVVAWQLHGLLTSNVAYQIATLLIPLLKGHPISVEKIVALEQRELKPGEDCVIKYLRFKHELTMSNHMLGIQLAEELLLDLSPEVPKYQLMVYVDLAEMYIQYEDPQNCIRLCVHALSLPITHTFSHIALQFVCITLPRILAIVSTSRRFASLVNVVYYYKTSHSIQQQNYTTHKVHYSIN